MSVLGKKHLMRALLLATCLLGVTAAPALAAPSWEATLIGTPETLPRTDELIEYKATVKNIGDQATSGPVTATLTLPFGGSDTGVFKVTASGWTCTLHQPKPQESIPANVVCFIESSLAPGASYLPITVAAQLGSEAPEPTGTATLTVEGGGAASPATAQSTYTFTPGFPFGIIDNGFIAGVYSSGKGIAPTVSAAPPTIVTITSIGAGSFEISEEAKATGPQVFSAGAAPFAIGETITGPGIPSGTTITAVNAQKLTLSKATTNEAREVPVTTGPVSGTATMVGAKELTEVVTATALGSTTKGSKIVTGVTTTKGTLSVGQGVESHGTDYTKAGGHPFEAYTSFGARVHHTTDAGRTKPIGNIRDVVVDAPRGFVGNALASPELCPSVEAVILKICPPKSAVGGTEIFSPLGSAPLFNVYPFFPNFQTAIFSVEPEFGQPAQFAFAVSPALAPITFVPELRADEGYAVSFRTSPIITTPVLYGANVTLCDFGARFNVPEFFEQKFEECKGPSDVDANPHPLITNPTRCSGPPPTTGLKLDSWQNPDEVKTYSYAAPPITECEDVPFEPESELIPTNTEAESPTGLNVQIKMPLEGVLSPTGVSQANLDTATVTLPKGMSINPATADGLQACSLAQIKLKSNAKDECPESSKVGTVEIDTPLIRETLTGSVFVARQKENPFNSTLGLYMDFDSKRDGVRIKVAGQLITDPQTGQLTSVFTENPEAPFSRLALKFNGGPRAALINPPKCGTYAIHSEFSPWSAVNPANPTPAEVVAQDSTYQVTSGPNGSPCPPGNLEAKLNAGLTNPQAGAKSPFNFTLTREDGSQRFTGLDVTTPKGLTAYLKGIPYCSDATLAGISGEELTGAAELANPSCPAASQVGTVLAGAGSGPFPFQAPGKVYLAGPYKNAPISLAVVTPAVAGPFDLGNVVIRNALYVNPESAQVTAKSDPIPTILHGILLDVRSIRLSLDRPSFTAAPTNCEPMSVDAHVSGEGGGSANLSNRFQVGGCEALGFKPKLSLRLFGGTHRSSHPRLVAKLTARPGDANIAGASVALPHSEFLDQAHIKTVCTRVQFAAQACPAGAIYGHAEAITPLLDNPVSGPVYLRSSNNPLPDLVVALRGPDSQPIEVVLDSRIDSVNGGIRSSFEAVPDQPVSSFTLSMQGGKKGLLVNSRNLCSSVNKATAKFTAQNGRTATLQPKLQNACKKKKAKKNKRHAKRRHSR